MASLDMPDQSQSHRRWWVLQVLTIGWRLLVNSAYLVQFAQLLRLDAFAEVYRYNPRFAVKALGHNYLARNLAARAGLRCFVHHYRRMYSSFPDRVLKMILHWDFPLYTTIEGGHSFSLDLGTSKPYDKEGELSLLLKVDSLIIFNLSFTIIPGWAAGSDAPEAFLISRLQGERSYSPEIRLATKAMCGVRPRALLFAALQGAASALEVEEIDAVSAQEQSSYCGCSESSFQNSYDDFFRELGIEKNGAGFFHCRVPIKEKPLELVDPNNRRTARKKQAFKAQIQSACAAAISRASGHISYGLEPSISSAAETPVLVAGTLLDEERG